ncbi:MAG: hypothetical protein ABIQ65_11750, partial [Thermoanaerobaculia bacterium]
PVSAQPLFPIPFVVQHQVVQSGAEGEEFRSDPVTDSYGGSWLVSERANGSRMVIDFARREMTEIDPAKGTYWTLSFSRMGELRQRIERAEGGGTVALRAALSSSRDRVTEIRIEDVSDASSPARSALNASSRAGVRHLRAASGATSIDVWLDSRVKLTKEARTALKSLESEALGRTGPAKGDATAGELLQAARENGDGAFPVRTRRSVSPRDPASGGVLEDEVTRLEVIPAFPQKLVSPGPGFKRVPSPLEAMASFAEDEASIRSTGSPR